MFHSFRVSDSFDEAPGSSSYVPTFSPEDLGGIVAWFKADVGITESGGLVSAWADQSPTGVDLTQITEINKPEYITDVINGLPVVRYNGDKWVDQSTTRILDNGDSGCTIFTIMQADTQGAGARTVFQTTGVNGIIDQSNSRLYYNVFQQAGSTNFVTAPYDWENTGFHVQTLDVDFTRSSQELRLFGNSTAGSFAALSGTGFYEPALSPALRLGLNMDYGDIAEFIIYNVALSQANREAVWTYFEDKYALTIF
jgi:hypothetical protein